MNIPKSERIMTTYVFDGVKCYLETRNAAGKYVLYKILNNDYQKLKTSETPVGFYEIIEKDRCN